MTLHYYEAQAQLLTARTIEERPMPLDVSGAGGSLPIATTPQGHPIVKIAGETIVCEKLRFDPVDDALAYSDAGDRTPNDPLAVLAEEVRSVRKKWRSDQRLLAGAFLLLKEAGVMPDSTKLIDAAERAEAAMREANAADEGRAKRVPSGRLLDSEPQTLE